MIIKTLTVGSIEENVYIAYDAGTREAIVFDPGFEGERIYQFISQNELIVKYIVITHTHYDHIGAVAFIKKKTNAKVCVHKADAEGLVDPRISLAAHLGKAQDGAAADIILDDGDEISVANNTFKIIHTPGHTKGCICILCQKVLFSGDTLFRSDIGRCDLPGGNYRDILDSIQQKLMKLDDDVVVYPGHGPSSTIGYERKNNQYTKKEAYDLW